MVRAFCAFVLFVLCLFGFQKAFAQPAPVYTPPASRVGGAIGQSVTENMIRRGFAANDPRIAQTVRAISLRSAPLVADAAGATWLTAAARLTPWVAGGLLVYEGVNWYFDIQGKAYLSPPGTKTDSPVFSNGIVAGQKCWGLSNISADCWGSPQESLSYQFYLSKAQYPKASYGVPSISYPTATTSKATYNYSIPELFLNNQSGTKDLVQRNAPISCPGGSGYVGNGCVSAMLNSDSSPWKGAEVVGYPVETAYANLPQVAKDASMTPDLAAELANRHWQDAAKQPGYEGYPFPTANPVTQADAAKLKSVRPEVWPRTKDLTEPVPTSPSANTIVAPISYPSSPAAPSTTPVTTIGTTTNPDGSKSTTTSTSTIEWGTFTPPDLDTPTIESILDPLFNMWPTWSNFAFPQHQSVCPTPSFTMPASVMGGYTLHFTEMCTWTESVRPALQAAFAFAWALLIVFIVMGA